MLCLLVNVSVTKQNHALLIIYSFVCSTFNYRWRVECVHYIQFVYRKLEDKTGYAHF